MADEQELKEHIELQNKTIEEQIAEMEKIAATNKQLLAENEKLKTAPPPKDPEAAALKKQLDEVMAKNAEYAQKEEMGILAKEFPKIKDLSVVTGKTLEEKKASAKKISDMIPDEEPKLDEHGKPIVEDKGAKFRNVPPPGGPSADSLTKEQTDQGKKELRELHDKGDVKGVLDKCFELQPKASATLFQG